MAEASVRVQPLDGPWETIGASRDRKVKPETISLSANPKGSDTANFQLRRRLSDPLTDLSALTPIEFEIAGSKRWEGYIQDTPRSQSPTDEVVTVNCRGWQYELDDDVVDRTWVHSKLSDWQDLRGAPTAELGASRGAAIGQVNSDEAGAITLMTPNGVQVPTSMWVGVWLDLGVDSTAARIVIDWSASGGAAAFQLFARTADYPDALSFSAPQYSDAWAGIPNNVGGNVSAGNFPTPKRYVNIFMYCTATSTPAADVWFRLNKVSVYRSTAYESGSGATPGASIFKATDLIKDVLPFAPQLSQATDEIDPTNSIALGIPHFAPGQPQSPNELMDAINALHRWVLKVGLGRKLQFHAIPTAPSVEIGDWSGSDFQDASTNSAEEIVNKALVEGTGPDGLPLRLIRLATQLAGAPLLPTLADKRGRLKARRIPVSAIITLTIAQVIADAFLLDHVTTPFKGSVAIGVGGAKQYGSQAPLHPSALLDRTMELMRLSHLQDPDTGALGRDGTITSVTYENDSEVSSVSIDNQRDNIEAVLARFSIVSGGT